MGHSLDQIKLYLKPLFENECDVTWAGLEEKKNGLKNRRSGNAGLHTKTRCNVMSILKIRSSLCRTNFRVMVVYMSFAKHP